MAGEKGIWVPVVTTRESQHLAHPPMALNLTQPQSSSLNSPTPLHDQCRSITVVLLAALLWGVCPVYSLHPHQSPYSPHTPHSLQSRQSPISSTFFSPHHLTNFQQPWHTSQSSSNTVLHQFRRYHVSPYSHYSSLSPSKLCSSHAPRSIHPPHALPFSPLTTKLSALPQTATREVDLTEAEAIRQKMRNVAIIAHVDHGKTTLVDQLLRAGGMDVSRDCVLDSNTLERERGITILSKATRVIYGDYTFNIVDTPGHADFGGEVERIMSMVDAVVLLVDIVEGPRQQTRFVLKKALGSDRIKPVVVLNKVDRLHDSSPESIERCRVLAEQRRDEILDLFLSLNPHNSQLDYPVLYASGRNGWVVDNITQVFDKDHPKGVSPLFDAIIREGSPPSGELGDPFTQLVTLLESVEHKGIGGVGKIYSGTINKGDIIHVKKADSEVSGRTRVKEIHVICGVERTQVQSAQAGDIVSILYQGGVTPKVTDTLMSSPLSDPIPSIPIDSPIISMGIGSNTSPWAGVDGKFLSSHQLKERLAKEALTNVAISLHQGNEAERFVVSGRGELQMAILIETLRREGVELCLTKPTVRMYTDSQTGETMEPWEEMTVILPQQFYQAVNDMIVLRRFGEAQQATVNVKDETVRAVFHVSSRNLLGIHSDLREMTKGSALTYTEVIESRVMAKQRFVYKVKRCGALIAANPGETTAHDLVRYAQRGYKIFVPENTNVYTGMIFGETTDHSEVECNPCKGVAKANIRTLKKGGVDTRLLNVKPMTIEAALNWIQDDEELEVTPTRVTLKKRILDQRERKKDEKRRKGEEY
eukprot:GHVN01009259.1.p1 GENE.GHVN01009259.1~~GHVN01009259.1.p1  ORF type:complete len:816 (-),score=182.45 GHVN01009259.1:256-2703(-)